MKKLILVILSLGFIFIVFSCENQPMAPKPTEMDMPLSLAKKTVSPFMANADDWFVLDMEGGGFTFAQFFLDPPDDDVTELPNGHVLLKNRELHSPLRQDETESCNFLNGDWKAVQVVISASLNEDLNGPGHGTISITGTWEGLTGTFEGRFSGFFSDDRGDDLFEGRFNAKGIDGDFIGMKMKGTMLEIQTAVGGNDFILEGDIYSH